MSAASNLGRFVAVLALDSERRRQFLVDPTAAMDAAGIDAEEQAVLSAGKLSTLLDYLDAGRARPVGSEEATGGGGGGPRGGH